MMMRYHRAIQSHSSLLVRFRLPTTTSSTACQQEICCILVTLLY
ncbi:rCG50741 [Rattus norvegicus]|uniref:RCG50741 n=1 Tax=Rattus norvegicus TaxID=10116 RepID=A6KC18_RAT|nr:rCG50741 [Rattus norvegicus]